jgi:hypothetical protein
MIISKDQLVANINNDIVDNADGLISARDVRQNLLNLIDSVHLLLEGNSIQTNNFATPHTKSTKAGELTLDKISLDGYFSIENSAFGYGALKSNYQGGRNTALGAEALNCNIYGSGNLAAGATSLGGNTTGNGNIGIGNNTLINNKIGNYNIALGHSAGYYANRNTNYKLFIASHPVDSDYICANPDGVGLKPLVYGDLSPDNLKLGVAVRTLHEFGSLQINGGVAPQIDGVDNIGFPEYRFKNYYLSDSINFPNNTSITYTPSSTLVFNGNILPSGNNLYTLGNTENQWKDVVSNSGTFVNLHVTGQAIVNQLISTSDCVYSCSTLYLASSSTQCDGENNGPCGHLPDILLNGAGIVIKGVNRDYNFLFRPSGTSSLNYVAQNIFAQSHWESNISIHLDNDSHIKSNRLISEDDRLSLLTDPSGYGLHIRDNNVFFSHEDLLIGSGNFNIIAPSGTNEDYVLTLGSYASGVNITQRFIGGLENNNKLNGFELKYIDDSNIDYEGSLSDRFVIKSFDNSVDSINNIVFMKNYGYGGVLGINNFDTAGDTFYPNTIVNARSKDNAVIRITAEKDDNVHSAMQLLGGKNCLDNGYETIYYHNSGIVDHNLYQESLKNTIYRFTNYEAGLYSSGVLNATLTIGYSGFPQSAISLKDNSDISVGSEIVASSGYGKIYNDSVDRLYANQSHALYFIDASGYKHDLTTNKFDNIDARAIYSEPFIVDDLQQGNTFAGYLSPSGRLSIVGVGNTAYGTESLYSIYNGLFNTTVGLKAGHNIYNGRDNTFIGAFAGSGVTSGNNNIAIGSAYHTHSNINHSIVIGNNLSVSGDYSLLIGNNNSVLVSGCIGPLDSDKVLALPSNGKLNINNLDNTQQLSIQNNHITIQDNGDVEYTDEQLKFNFTTPSGTNTLLTLDHSYAPSGQAEYSCSGVPFLQVDGHIRVRNNICFSDTTSLGSAQFLDDISNLQVSGIILNEIVNSLFVEGIALSDIMPATNYSNPTTGTINYNESPVTITNRDKFLKIEKEDFIIAIRIKTNEVYEYRPIWVSSQSIICNSCHP